MRRHTRYCVAIAALICGLSASATLADQRHPYRSAALVCLELTMVDYLSGSAFTTMREEATRIWIRHGIALTWSQPEPPACAEVVPIVFDLAGLQKVQGGKRTDALAVTVFSGRSRVIYVSVARAFDLLVQTRQMSELPSNGERDLRGGMLLGRVVAHELGHVLLNTMSHSDRGLMRPVFGFNDALSVERRTTELSPIESDRLAMRFSLIPIESSNALAQQER